MNSLERQLLKRENEKLREKLRSDFGMMQSRMPVDPELENEWLKHVFEFETAAANCRQVTVHEFLGKPEFREASCLKDKEIPGELWRLMEIMSENGVELTSACAYPDRLIYSFITEELFNHEIDEIRIKGMMHCFIYEEFHPNHEHDLKRLTSRFFEALEKGVHDMKDDLHSRVSFQESSYSNSDFMMTLMMLCESCGQFDFMDHSLTSVEFDLNTGTGKVTGDMRYGNLNGNFSGEFRLGFIYDDQWWFINSISLPGFSVS